jgi:hypothetical protein
MRKATLKYFIAANAAVFAMVAAPAALDHFYGTDFGWMPSAYAGDSVPKGQACKPEGTGQKGKGGPSQDVGGQGQGQGGPGVDSDAKGPRFGGGENSQRDTAARGGKPIWGQDGLVNPATGTTAELGRLNVSRAPVGVFNRQLTEALAAIAADPTLAAYYAMSLAEIQAADLDNVLRLDSPLANLAILKTLLTTKDDVVVKDASGATVATIDYNPTTLAILLGSASDKYVAINQDTVYAIFKILLKAEPADYDLVSIATTADAVRTEIMTDHDN